MKNGLLALTFLVSGFSLTLYAQSSDLDESRDLLREWVNTRNIISEEKNEWLEEKAVLEDIIATLESEISGLDEEIEEFEEELKEADSERLQLQQEQSRLRGINDALETQIGGFVQQVLALAEFLPEPLADKASVSRLVDALRTQVDRGRLGDRAVGIIALMQEIDQFNSGVHVERQLLELEGETPREYSVIYFGLAKAYYVDDTLERAGYGLPAKGGWEWTSEPRMAQAIQDAVDIREQEKLADMFIPLPVDIKDIDIPEIPE